MSDYLSYQKPPTTVHATIRCTKIERERWALAARYESRSMSAWIRFHLNKLAKRRAREAKQKREAEEES